MPSFGTALTPESHSRDFLTLSAEDVAPADKTAALDLPIRGSRELKCFQINKRIRRVFWRSACFWGSVEKRHLAKGAITTKCLEKDLQLSSAALHWHPFPPWLRKRTTQNTEVK